MQRDASNRQTVESNVPEMQPLEKRQLMAATVELPFRLDFKSYAAGTVVDKDGQGTGFAKQTYGTAGQIDVSTAKLGTLALTADASTGKSTAALETAFDGTTRGFTITARLLGPLSTLKSKGDQTGVYFGPDLNNCVKVAAIRTSTGEQLQFATFVNGKSVGETNLPTPTAFASMTTLDVQITGDAVTGQVTARYAINGKSWQKFTATFAVPAASRSGFYNAASRAGVITADKNGPITAVFDSFSIDAGVRATTPVASLSRTLVATSDLSTNNAGGAPQTVRVTNTGAGDLVISGASFTGDNAGEFKLTNPVSGPITLKTGERYDFYVVFTATNSGSVRTATLTLATNDPAGNPTVALRGLGLAGTGGAFEPSLQRIIDTYGFKTATGQSTSSNAFDSSIKSADEVDMPRLIKANTGKVSIELLGVFANQVSKTTFGWYESGNPQSKYLIGGVNAADAQSLSPTGNGQFTFDPGSGNFALYGNFTLGSDKKPINRDVFSEDSLNTWETNTNKQKKVRFYKLRDSGGNVVENAYVVTFEEYNVTFDQNDIVAIVRNVKPAVAAAELGIENLDNAPFADQLVMSRVRDLDEKLPNQFHDKSTLRIRNTGSQPLNISDLVLSNTDFQIVSGGGAKTIAPNGYADVVVQFVYNESGQGNRLRKATLTIKSDDADESTKTVKLSGLWQSHSENQPNGKSAEPTAELAVEAFGYSTKITYAGQNIDTKGVATPVGDEVLSELWQRADIGLPVTVRMLATYHQQYDVQWNTHSTLFTYDPKVLNAAKDNKPTLTKQLSHNQLDSQSVLPRLDGSDSLPAQASFVPGSQIFGFNIDGYNSTFSEDKYNTPNDANNPGHGWRFYVAKDANGNIIPDTYLACQDYVKVSWANYDYQDNILLITNIKPTVPPLTVQNVQATPLVDGNAVTWKANTANDVTSYNVWRRTAGTDDSFAVVANASGSTFTDTTAKKGTTYEYYVTAVAYQGGESAKSNTSSALAGSGISPVPVAASNAVAVANASNSVTVTWKDNAANESGYRVERKSGTGAYVTVGTVAANATTFTDKSVTATTTYTYRVVAVGTVAGDATASNESTVTTPQAAATNQTLAASADAYVFDGSTAANFGSATGLQVKKGATGFTRQAYLTFGITSLATVNTATLRLFTNLNTTENASVQIAAYGTASAIEEGSVNWTNKPATSGGLLGTAVVTGTGANWVEIDVSAFVKAAVAAGKTRVTFALQGTASTASYVNIASRETGDTGPQLQIT